MPSNCVQCLTREISFIRGALKALASVHSFPLREVSTLLPNSSQLIAFIVIFSTTRGHKSCCREDVLSATQSMRASHKDLHKHRSQPFPNSNPLKTSKMLINLWKFLKNSKPTGVSNIFLLKTYLNLEATINLNDLYCSSISALLINDFPWRFETKHFQRNFHKSFTRLAALLQPALLRFPTQTLHYQATFLWLRFYEFQYEICFYVPFFYVPFTKQLYCLENKSKLMTVKAIN